MKLKTWDGHNINDSTNYVAVLNANFYGLPGIKAIMGMRHGSWPILGGVERPGRELNFEIYIRSGTSLELEQWFDPEDETAKQLIAEDDAGGNDRYIYAICTELREVPFGAGLHYAVSLQIDGDVRWRETSATVPAHWDITASGQTASRTNNGQDDCYPILKIKPTGARSSGGFAYKRLIIVKWNTEESVTNYPVNLSWGFDTAALTTAKMQADGDDLRVYVNGVEVDRWLGDMDTANTKVWINKDFEANISMTLNGAHSDSVTTVYVNEDITNMPSSGILYIGTEIITYTGKNNQDKKFTGCTRGAKGTSAAAHSDNDDTYWIQYDIWIYYGDSTLSAPAVDDDYKPMIELDSPNSTWDFNDFKETAKPNRSGSWQTQLGGGTAEFYGGNQGASADPFVEIGIKVDDGGETGYFFLGNPCGILSANFTNGEHYHDDVTYFQGKIVSNIASGGTPHLWVTEYAVPAPASDATWDTWNRDEALASSSKAVGLYNWGIAGDDSYIEAADCVVTIADEPTTVVGSEQSNYTLSCTIKNNTTGDAIEVDFDMELNETLEINTDEKTVIYLAENSNQFNSLDLVGGSRVHWLPLQPGSNTLQFDDTGTGNVRIDFEWDERYYQ